MTTWPVRGSLDGRVLEAMGPLERFDQGVDQCGFPSTQCVFPAQTSPATEERQRKRHASRRVSTSRRCRRKPRKQRPRSGRRGRGVVFSTWVWENAAGFVGRNTFSTPALVGSFIFLGLVSLCCFTPPALRSHLISDFLIPFVFHPFVLLFTLHV